MASSRRRAQVTLFATCLLLCSILLAATFGPAAAGARARPSEQLQRCRAANPAHPARCDAKRRAPQHAASRLARAGRAFWGEVRASPTNGPSAGASGTSTSPNRGQAPSEPAPSTPAGGEPPASGEPAPPLEAPAQGSATFQPGINSGSAAIWELPGAVQLGAKLVRIDFGIEQTAAQIEPVIAAYAAKGIRVAPLADFNGSMPTPAEAQDLAGWAKAYGPGGTYWSTHSGGQFAIQTIEFGNETSYSYQYSNDTASGYASRAQTYALRFAEAARAIRSANPGVGLLAQGDAGNSGSIWVENMFKAVPNLAQLVAGWTIHPYGSSWRSRLQTLIAQTAAQGAPSSIPIDITEWGLSTDNGDCVTENYGWNACMSYQEAAEVLNRTVGEMHQLLGSRLGMFLLYKIRDQQPAGASDEREAYFGAVQSELQPKGAYTTAVESLLSSS
jgi:hypothetical protein